MPRLSRWSIHAALLYLAAGFTLGGWMLTAKGFPDLAPAWRWLTAHMEFLLFGWTVQLILGVAYWILPRFARGSARGFEPLAWTAIVLLNLGIWLVVVRSLGGWPEGWAFVGRGLEAVAGIAFVAYAWRRVKPSGA